MTIPYGSLADSELCPCGHRLDRDHKRTMRGDFFCWVCPDDSLCHEAPPNEAPPEATP